MTAYDVAVVVAVDGVVFCSYYNVSIVLLDVVVVWLINVVIFLVVVVVWLSIKVVLLIIVLLFVLLVIVLLMALLLLLLSMKLLFAVLLMCGRLSLVEGDSLEDEVLGKVFQNVVCSTPVRPVLLEHFMLAKTSEGADDEGGVRGLWSLWHQRHSPVDERVHLSEGVVSEDSASGTGLQEDVVDQGKHTACFGTLQNNRFHDLL